jgi:hypothetical protein
MEDGDSSSSEAEVFRLDSAAPPEGSACRRERSGTYTKDKPSLTDLDVSELDLDDTLKASDCSGQDISNSTDNT